jgi:tRNA-dihydrouridine synthase B
VRIGNIELGEKPVLLAPMEDITDPSFRFLCKQYGADAMYTEFVSSDGLIRNAAKSVKKLELFNYERPIGIQIYGHIPEAMVGSAKIAEEAKPDLIDINFGCPVKKIARRGAGSGMMNNVPLMVEITTAIVKAVNLPVTVKTRLGYDDNNKNIVEIAERLQDCGIKAIAIHGRTRNQMYKGEADWTLIGNVKNNQRMYIPVIGNGDINSALKAKEAFDKYGVDGIMVGRATVGRPWIFKEIKQYLQTGEIIPPPLLDEIIAIAKIHFQKSIETKGEKGGILEMRRHFVHYFKGLPNFRENRIKLLTSMNIQDILLKLDEIKETYSGFRYEKVIE